MSQKNNYPLYVKWMDIVPWIMARTERFPKNLRYSLAQKIDNICLEILELIVQTIFSQAKREPLLKINLKRCLNGIEKTEQAYIQGKISAEVLYQSTRSRMGFIGYARSTLLLQSIWGRNQQAGLTV